MPYLCSSYLLKYWAPDLPVEDTQFLFRLGSDILHLPGLSIGDVEENALKEATFARRLRFFHSQSLY